MRLWLKRLFFTALALVIAGGFYVALKEKPILVDVARVTAGPMRVTIDEEGETRVRDVYTVSSPMDGHLERIELEEGDGVKANDTIIASIRPLDPPFIDERTRTELLAALEAARSAVKVAEVELTRAEVALSLAKSEYQRASKLANTNIISQSQLEKAYNAVQLQEAQVESAKANIRLRNAELDSARARITQTRELQAHHSGEDCCMDITAPVNGVVLDVIAESEQAVTSGTKLVDIGDPQDLEIAVDLLSSDAVKIKPGTKVAITEWGGDEDLQATVRRIDPAAFTKVSALGIEEQRVNVILDLDEVPEGLGHGYRVFARLTIWSGENVLQVPIGAIFRANGNWSVFAVADGKADLRRIRLGHMNASNAEVLEGLSDGDSVILYPNDLLSDGSLVEDREAEGG
ncbi:efflux RND transporter periplasmic adaptor subunit [Rhizobiales bacterium]|uniref:efflux RND transporter periplasmic adaptor subunit n=1 Tax=Hongsoonwoonella zoysiae TaxID=2821844 RepID=UPI001560CA63|nr:efflux RND transporter periplasmic adaptor subunit [Hongsoonwoonella zoysiae]NRG17524.1 efflux RND transporter periplasmic adaptor subunit [Hongsoonwoonella zoysiae]